MKRPGAPCEADLFDVASKLVDDEREAFLERACAGDDVMRQRLETLLSVGRRADEFFDEIGATLSFSGSLVPLVKEAAHAADLLGEEPIGTCIGRYKLLQKIGTGGCGVVYLAEQEEPVRLRVALKIIRLGMETQSVIARFEAERQALAMMEHPNIARVFDAGATKRGLPYFVMELVRGVRITDYCDQNQLGIRARLDLFVQVCHAIRHAHQKGIVHGDIKPSNIIISLHDGTPLPKVIDFGISKATEARLTDQTLFDASSPLVGLIGTPAYMSPEQAHLNGMDVDTRSDIYSLGVLLHELLTGKTPFDAKQLLRSGSDAIRQTLREITPPLPSRQLGELRSDELIKIAERRQSTPEALTALLHHDLDWVVAKAMEKNRDRRYETANGLAMDVRRYLENEPVLARPPARLYRFRKLVRRNRAVFAAGLAVAAALVAGFGTSTWLFVKERAARQRAVAAEHEEARLRHQAENREKISEAALLVRQEKYEESDELLQRVVLSQPSVEGAAVLRAVGGWYAIHGRWRLAADRFALLLTLNQRDGMDTATLDQLRYGPALVELGDGAAYERFRDELITRYTGNSGRFAADRIVRISLLLPASPPVLDSLNPLATVMTRLFTETHAAGDEFLAGWQSLSVALWEYRQGNFTGAMVWSLRSLSYRDAANAPRPTMARLILAMAYAQLEMPAEALMEFEQSRETIEAKFKTRLDRGTPIQGFWFDWSFARILLREATGVVVTPAIQP
ncbi:MAG: serine/threonine-protein kinase [Opitutaceae bacterium]